MNGSPDVSGTPLVPILASDSQPGRVDRSRMGRRNPSDTEPRPPISPEDIEATRAELAELRRRRAPGTVQDAVGLVAASSLVRSALVPELLVSSLDESLSFWCSLCGFAVLYDRPEDRFAYLGYGGAQVMLEEAMAPGRHWVTAPLQQPFGRGINLQIAVDDVAPILASLHAASWPLYLALEETWYRAGDDETGVRQFLVQDPDGYLLRFSQGIGLRPTKTSYPGPPLNGPTSSGVIQPP